ncbi:MAG: galactose mutarotase [Silicimonas sp.]|nr:galactose mutarotase [Silicimonas sp.]
MTDNTILALSAGRTSIEVWTLGARLNAATWDGDTGLVDGAASVDEALGPKLNHGSVAGPVANRIAGGSAEIDGKVYDFEKNENEKTLLHSGSKSTRDAIWRVAEQTKDSARLTLARRHLQDGFPGNRRIEARYLVTDEGFDLTFTATSDAPTLMNLALHPYWTLGRARDDLLLHLSADTYLPVNTDKIPTGAVDLVDNSIFDLRAPRRASPDIDHNFCFPGTGAIDHVASLRTDRLRLDIETDAPGLQVYTGNPSGIALEPQHWPDAPHHPAFPSILLSPGEVYRQTSRYRFSRPA